LSPTVRRRILILGAIAALTAAVFLVNRMTPPQVRLGQLYLVPVLLAAWYEGLWWGVAFLVAALLLRIPVEFVQQPDATIVTVLINQASFAAVAGITIAGFLTIRRTQTQLEDLVIHDPLTRVLNARAFSERLAQELRRNRRYGRPLSLLYLDLDDFKIVNDSHGHQTGNAVLRLVAEAIRGAMRQADIVGRMGGDEFAVLMPETASDVAEAAAGRLAKSLREAFHGNPSVTASIGIVSCTDAAVGPDDVLHKADRAMYEAKSKGKDQAVKVAM